MVGSSVVGPNRQPVQGVPCPFSLSRRASEEGKQCDVLPLALVSARPSHRSPDSTSDNIVGRVDGIQRMDEQWAQRTGLGNEMLGAC